MMSLFSLMRNFKSIEIIDFDIYGYLNSKTKDFETIFIIVIIIN